MSTCLQSSFFCGAPVPIVPARIPSLSRNMLRQNQSAAMRAPLAELHPHPSSAGRHPQSGGCEDRVLAQDEAGAGPGDGWCRSRAPPCKHSACRLCSRRVAREPGFAQKARGQGSLGTLSSAALAIANAVQFSVCSGVLRVLGLARALPRDIVQKTNAPQRPN